MHFIQWVRVCNITPLRRGKRKKFQGTENMSNMSTLQVPLTKRAVDDPVSASGWDSLACWALGPFVIEVLLEGSIEVPEEVPAEVEKPSIILGTVKMLPLLYYCSY